MFAGTQPAAAGEGGRAPLKRGLSGQANSSIGRRSGEPYCPSGIEVRGYDLTASERGQKARWSPQLAANFVLGFPHWPKETAPGAWHELGPSEGVLCALGNHKDTSDTPSLFLDPLASGLIRPVP
jgi:hypothetical protein